MKKNNERDEMPRNNYSNDVEDNEVENSYAYFAPSTNIVDGMKVKHKAIEQELTVVADEKGPAYTGNEFKDDEISLSHAIQEYKAGNLSIYTNIEQREGLEWDRIINFGASRIVEGDRNICSVFKESEDDYAAMLAQAKNMYKLLQKMV